MKNLLSKLFHLGLAKISSYDAGKRLVFFNKILFLYSFVVFVFIFIFQFLNLTILSWVLFVFFLFYILCFFLNFYGYIFFSKLLFLFNTCLGFFLHTVCLGLDSGVQNGFFSVLIIVLIIFNEDQIKLKSFFAILSIILFYLLNMFPNYLLFPITIPDSHIKLLFASFNFAIFLAILETIRSYFQASKELKSDLISYFKVFSLSPREIEVVAKIIEGNSNKQIAEVLFISETTVKTHTLSIYRKLRINSRTELLRFLIVNII